MKILRIALVFALLAVSLGAQAQVELFGAARGTSATSSQAASGPAIANVSRAVSLNTAAMQAMRSGDEASFSTPAGDAYVVTFERSENAFAGGTVWVGYLRDYGKNFPVIISIFQGQVSGTIATPKGKQRLQGSVDRTLFSDARAMHESERGPGPGDALVPPAKKNNNAVGAKSASADASANVQQPAIATAGNPAQIDVLILYTPGFGTALAGSANSIARANQLVATANQVYINSNIYIHLTAVNVIPFTYPDNDSMNINAALNDITTGIGSSVMTNTISALREQYGADLVMLLREFKSTSADACGLAWEPDPSVSWANEYGFSVIDDVVSSGVPACDGGTTSAGDTAPTHEMGHNMGAAHDLYTSSAVGLGQETNVDGFPGYNRGFCNGVGGSVMSYSSSPGCEPTVPVFSNPALAICNSAGTAGVCGVAIGSTYTAFGSTTYTAVGADSATALNLNGPYVAAYRNHVSGLLFSAGSRKTHSVFGTYDVPINPNAAVSSNTLSVEPRAAESGNVHRLVFTFNTPISSVGGVQLAGKSGSVLGTGTAASPAISGNTVSVSLSNVPDRKRLQVTLVNINGVVGANATVSLAYLYGDVTLDRQVSGIDAVLAGANSPAISKAGNFLYNVSLSGTITALDKGVISASSPKAVE